MLNDIIATLENLKELEKLIEYLEKENIPGRWVVNKDKKTIVYWWTYGEDYDLEQICLDNHIDEPNEMFFTNEPDNVYMLEAGNVFTNIEDAVKYWVNIL